MTRVPAALCLAAALATAAAASAQERPRLHDVAEALVEAAIPARDDPDAVVARLLDVARNHATSAAAALCVDATSPLLSRLRDREVALESLRALRTEQSHGLVEKAASSLLRRLLLELGRDGEADAIDEFGDYARHWITVGPFGDGGDYYNGAPFAPEFGFPALGATLVGRSGPVTPRVVRRSPARRTVALAPKTAREGCQYGLVQLRAVRPIGGYAEVLTRASFELFVGRERVADVVQHTGPTPNRFHVPVRLASGINHVVLKTTLARVDVVALRFVDARGRALAGVEEVASGRVELAAGDDAERPPAPPPFVDDRAAIAQAARSAAGTPDAFLLAIAHALAQFDAGAADHGLDALWPLLEAEPPSDPRLCLALAKAITSATDLPPEFRAARTRPLVEKALGELPSHHAGTLLRVAELQDEDRLEDAIRLLEQRIRDGDGGAETHAALHAILARLGFEAEARRVRDDWHRVHPTDPRPIQIDVEARVRADDHVGALTVLREALERTPGHRGMLQASIELLANTGDRSAVEAALARLERDAADALDAARSRAEALWRLGAIDEALAIQSAIASDASASAAEINAAGRWLARGGKTEDALAAFERSLALEPGQHDLRRLLARARGADEFATIARFRRDADDLIAGFQASERERGAPSSVLLDQMIVEFHADGSHVEETHVLRRINDLSGVEAHEQADRAARADELVRLRTIGTDGASYYPRRVAQTFSMPRLEPGAFVEEVYREFANVGRGEPWRGPMFLFQSESEPFLLSELVLILPAGHRGSIRVRSYTDSPEIVELDDGRRAWRFTRRDVPRLPAESLAPPIAELAPVVTFGSDRSFGETVRAERARAHARSRSTAPVRAATERILQGIDGDSARLRAIHEFVHSAVPDSRGAADPTSILLRRQGPRFFLLVAMLAAAGIPFEHAAAAATHESLGDRATPLFLGDDQYDVPAARVSPRDGSPLWLFADTPRFAPPGAIPIERSGAAVLLLGERATLERLPPADPSVPDGQVVRGRVDLTSAGDARLVAAIRFAGLQGIELAERMRTLDANRRDLVARSLATRLFAGWTVEAATLAPADRGQELSVDVTITRRGALQTGDDADFVALPLAPSRMFERLGDRADRVLPLRIDERVDEVWEIVVETGSRRIVALPEPIRVRTALLDYELSVDVVASAVHVRRRIALRPGDLVAGAFGQWVRVLEQIDRAEAQRLWLR